jgi:AcrR family transcriptional regulator
MARPPRSRQPIKDAALRLFVEGGIAATGVRDIAKAAECSEAALYRHWANKEELVRSLFKEHLGEVVGLLDEALNGEEARNTATDERLRTAIAALYRLYDRQPHVFRFVLLVQHELAPFLTEDDPTAHRLIQEFTKGLVERGESSDDPIILAAALIGVVMETASRVVYGVLPAPLSDHAEAVTAFCLRLVRP